MGKKTVSKNQREKKRWNKGESCVSNPTNRKFRDGMRQNMTSSHNTKSVKGQGRGLTAAALSKHNNEFESDDEIITDASQANSTGSSMPFSISGLTDCSNMTFQKVHKLWTSPLEEHKQICAILAAVTEIIRAEGGKETETEYFAALVSALESADDEEALAAIVFLINLVIKRIPQAVLRVKFSEVSKALAEVLGKHSMSEKTSLLKNLLSCLATLLQNQDYTAWQNSSTQRLFLSILNYTTFPRPKVRKTAQVEVAALIKIHSANNQQSTMTTTTANFCMQNLQEHGSDESTSTLHILNLLKMTLAYLPSESVKKLCEAVMNIMRNSNTLLKLNCMQTLYAMFEARPQDSSMTAILNGKIISALYDFQPSINDVNVAEAWLKVMQSAHVNLSILGEEECMASLPRMFATVMMFVLSNSRLIVSAAAETAKVLVGECLVPITSLIENESENKDTSIFQNIFRQIEHGLKFKYQPAWDIVLQLITLFFKEFGKSCHSAMTKCLVTLCDFHDSREFPFKQELEKAISMAIKSFGPSIFLKAAPLNLVRTDKKCEFPRAWILSLMKDNIENAEVQFFVSHFLPQAAHLREREIAAMQNGQILEAKIYETLQQQVWALLPGFFNNPVDLADSFKNIARVLGKALVDEPKLRLVILQSLRAVTIKGVNSERDAEELKKYSKNYLPILFNLFLTESENGNESVSLPALQTIKAYIRITDTKLVNTFMDNAYEKLKSEENSKDKRTALMDLIIAMVGHVDETCIRKIYDATVPLIKSADKNEQKKAYRILEELCDGTSDGCRNFVLANLEEIKQNLFTSMSAAAPSSKAPRLRCLTGIVRKLSAGHNDFLTSILAEVILCTKANNVKAKASAFNLLEEIGNCIIYNDSRSKEESVTTYIDTIMAGLAASSHMISATLQSLGKLSIAYKESLSPDVVKRLLLASVSLLRSKDREVIKSALAFAKALITYLDREELLRHVEILVKNLFDGKRGDKNVLRTQTRFILEKLIRKIGFPVVRSATPEEHRKFVSTIHKANEKRKKVAESSLVESSRTGKRHNTNQEVDDSDLSSDDETSFKKNDNQKGKKSASWIMEESDEVVDLLDTKMATKISGTQPAAKSKTAKEDIAINEDGKLVIEDDKIEGSSNASFNESSLARKRGISEERGSDETMTYQPGGSGIHRAGLKKARLVDEEAPKKFGAEYKAKKAGGDMKVKGKPDPFAYIALDRKNLNRRKRAKIAGQLKGIVKATKRINIKGRKLPGKRQSKMNK